MLCSLAAGDHFGSAPTGAGRVGCARHASLAPAPVFATSRVAVAPVHVVQRLLGHRELKSTEVYLHATLDDLMAAVEA